MILVVVILVLNAVISYVNCRMLGSIWDDWKREGGFWQTVVRWSGAIMAWAGWTYCYLLVALIIFAGNGMTEEHLKIVYAVGFFLIVPPIVITGWVITIESWRLAIREGGGLNWFVTFFNTLAIVHDTNVLLDGAGGAASTIGDIGSSGGFDVGSIDFDENTGPLVLILVVALICLTVAVLGWLTTWLLVRRYRRMAACAA